MRVHTATRYIPWPLVKMETDLIMWFDYIFTGAALPHRHVCAMSGDGYLSQHAMYEIEDYPIFCFTSSALSSLFRVFQSNTSKYILITYK